MNGSITQQLAVLLEECHSLSAILDRAVHIIADDMAVDACSIFLVEPPDRRLHLSATWGLDPRAKGVVSLAQGEGLLGQVVTQMCPLAVADAAQHPAYRYVRETGEERFVSFLGVPMILRGRPVGAVVVQSVRRREFTEEEIRELVTLAAQLVGLVANARLIEALDRGEQAEQFLALPALSPHAVGALRQHRVLKGRPASPGIAIGAAVWRSSFALDPDSEGVSFQGEEKERARLRRAMEQTRSDIQRIQRAAARETDEEHALIFSSHLLLLHDPVLHERIDRSVATGVSAPLAVDHALTEFGQQLQSVADPYIQDRVEDIHDLRSRLLRHLLSSGPGSEARLTISNRIVISNRIPPSLVVEIKTEGARGLITEIGGATSHGVLLARSMGIPVVSRVVDIASLQAGDPLIVDGATGTVIVHPDPETILRYQEAVERSERQRTASLEYRARSAQTADGVGVRLTANVSLASDFALARDNGAEGVGLYRTEFPFILREQFPTREEQIKIYGKAYEVFPKGPINFRLLDLGGDKFVPQGTLAAARNPFHGYRSIRVLFDHPHVLYEQVQAFALAAGSRPLRLLIPMVSSLEELRRMKQLIADAIAKLPGSNVARTPAIGVMIEVPAAVEVAADLAAEVDFVSVGTNDLIQYSLVKDREDPRMASASDAYHPAILRMLRRIILSSHAAGKPVSVCGELAAVPSLALLLVAMGVDELSVVPTVIPELKQALASARVAPVKQRLPEILAWSETASIEAELRKCLV